MEQKKHRRYTMFSVFLLLWSIGLGILGHLKEETIHDVTLPEAPPTVQAAMEDGAFTWDQTEEIYFLRIENTGEDFTKVSVKYGPLWPKYAIIIRPGDTWELAVENALPFTHTITFENEEGTPSGTVEAWSITQ